MEEASARRPVTGEQPGFLIRYAREDEQDEVSTLIRVAYQEYEPHYTPERWRGYIENVGNLRNREGYELIVAELNSRLVGAVLFYPDGSVSGQGEWPPGWAGILRLAVLPEARGLGIGRALVERCLQRCRELGIKTAGLHSTEWMAVARGMYERMGFVRVPEFDFRPRPGVVGMGFRIDL